MSTPAYIAMDDEGVITLYWGDGTEDEKSVIARGRRPAEGQDLLEAIEELKTWAEDEGYTVIVPAYDLEVPNLRIDITDEEADEIDLDDVDDLLDDLWDAGDYEE